MKNSLIIFFLLIGMATASFAQQGMGLNFNPEKLKNLAAFPDPNQGEKSIGNLPLNADLSSFSPAIINQGDIPSCVAWSTAYNAYTIQYAAQKTITNPAEIEALALSAMFPFKFLRPNCSDGLDLPDVAAQIMQSGNILHSEFNGTGCMLPPTSTLIERAAQNHPIMNYVKIFDSYSSNYEKIFRTQQQLGLFKTPVIVGVQVTRKLQKLTDTDEFYIPAGEVVGFHAVTVVGYTQKGFKILNTWGPKWGKGGYFWVSTNDFPKICVGGIALVLSNNYQPGPTPGPKTLAQIGGDFGFQFLEPSTGTFNKLTPTHLGNGVYELSRKNWHLGERFQLLTNNPTAKQFMCVFSIDAKNKLNVHWPRNTQLSEFNENFFGLGESEILPTTNFDVVIPSKESALTIEETGTDYLCVIYSDKPLLNELPSILNRIKNANGSIYNRIQEGLRDRLIPASNIRFDKNSMRAVANSNEGDTVSLVLKIQSVN